MHQVFISYSSKNKAVADSICMYLENNGITCWYAPRNIAPGQDWVEAIMDAIESARVFLLIFSSDSNYSRQVQNEVAAAFNAGCAIVPFRIDDTKMVSKMAYFLNSVHWLDAAHSPPANTYQELSSYIPKLLANGSVHPFSPAVTQPPKQEEQNTALSPVLFFKNLLCYAPSPNAEVFVELTLSADPSQPDQQVRGTAHLPHGIGHSPRVLVLTKLAAKATAAAQAGADLVGGEELAAKIAGADQFDFDVLVASPEIMGTVGRLSPVLSPRGLMPSPKAGTLTPDVAGTVRKIKAGQIFYRMNNRGRIRCLIGKASFGEQKLSENMEAVISAVSADKPASVTGKFILSCAVTVNGGTTKLFTTNHCI